MNRFPRTRFVAAIIALVLALIVVLPASAQEGETPQIGLSVWQASPGATIEITGGHFEPDIMVSFVLALGENHLPVGEFFADDHGDFTTAVLLPSDLSYETYEFRIFDEQSRVLSVPLEIVPELSEEEAGAWRERDEGFLAPIPTVASGIVPGTASQPAAVKPSQETSLENRASPNWNIRYLLLYSSSQLG